MVIRFGLQLCTNNVNMQNKTKRDRSLPVHQQLCKQNDSKRPKQTFHTIKGKTGTKGGKEKQTKKFFKKAARTKPTKMPLIHSHTHTHTHTQREKKLHCSADVFHQIKNKNQETTHKHNNCTWKNYKDRRTTFRAGFGFWTSGLTSQEQKFYLALFSVWTNGQHWHTLRAS